jgi:hypothetical protein
MQTKTTDQLRAEVMSQEYVIGHVRLALSDKIEEM